MTHPVLPAPAGFRGELLPGSTAAASYRSAAGPFRLTPRAVAVPRDGEDVARLVAWAAGHGLALVPRGAGTGMPGHNVGRDVVVDLTRLDPPGDPDPDERTLRAGPGVVASVLEERARSRGLTLAALPSSADRCTLGGMLATDAAGARSFRHGSVRERVRSVEVVLADGSTATLGTTHPSHPRFEALHRELASVLDYPIPEDPGYPGGPAPLPGWPRVRKNSSGYALDRFLPGGDACQLMAGSEGTLGLVTAATLELLPAPAERGVLLLAVPDPGLLPDVVGIADAVDASACEYFGRRIIEMAELSQDPELGSLAGGAHGLVLVEVEGSEEQVEEGLARLRRTCRAMDCPWVEAREAAARERLWTVRHQASPTIQAAAARGLHSIQFIEDCVVPVGALPAWLEGLGAILEAHATEAVIFGHLGDGNLHVNPLVDLDRPDSHITIRAILEETVAMIAELGGTLSGEHGDGRVRAPFLEDIWGPSLTAAFRRVKDRLDPGGVLNPGVVIPLAGQDPLDGLRRARR